MGERNQARTLRELPRLLMDARFMRGLSLREAAEQIGDISSTTLMRWEKGTATPSFEQLDRAAHWLGLEVTLVPRKPIAVYEPVEGEL